MACCYTFKNSHDKYAVSPMLGECCHPARCEQPPCAPSLPKCPKMYVYEKPKKVYLAPIGYECKEYKQKKHSDAPYYSHHAHDAVPCCPTCKQPTYEPITQPKYKPTKTKYVMPCYRYEDGRINQPTALMRRACEVALGSRSRKDHFMVSTFCADKSGEVSKFHCEDAKGNCCYHFECKKYGGKGHHLQKQLPKLPSEPCHPQSPCVFPSLPTLRPEHASCPEYRFVDCVEANSVDPPKTCCFYCC